MTILDSACVDAATKLCDELGPNGVYILMFASWVLVIWKQWQLHRKVGTVDQKVGLVDSKVCDVDDKVCKVDQKVDALSTPPPAAPGTGMSIPPPVVIAPLLVPKDLLKPTDEEPDGS
jgi:hypothetical protein